jgi:tetratricopeptide (TPR) repeat protein
MMNRAVLLLSIGLAGCASAPVTPPPEQFFNDYLFGAATERIGADDVFALSDEMKRYLDTEIAGEIRAKGSRQGLFDALYSEGQLKLDFDSVVTRNSAQAFAARSGNCLSLVIMTAAFAKEMGLPIRYQRALVDETWTRDGDVHFLVGHVNLTLGTLPSYGGFRRAEGELTIDFLPPREIRGLRTRIIGEETIIAMYMNNRAAELFAQGQLDNAYWWARAAIAQDPRYLSSYNTLGVIYKRHGNPVEAERVLGYALEREPANTRVMSNLVAVLSDLGRVAESKALAGKLERLEPDPPFSFFKRGRAAVRDGDFSAARDLFAKEVDRAPYYHEFHFWLAIAYLGLDDVERAKKELTIAMETSTTRNDRALYATKLDRMKSYRGQ